MSDGQEFESSSGDSAPTPMTAWQMLREARLARGLSISEVAQHLKLTPRQVEAMEAGDLAHLPGPAFARGFVRNYARFLQLDPAYFNNVLDVVRESPAPLNTMPLGQMPGPARWSFSSLPAFGIAAGLLALAIAGWHYRWFEPREEQYLADVMAQSGVSAETVSAPVSQSVPEAAPAQSVAVVEPSAPTVEIVAPSAVLVAPALPAAASAPVASSSSAAVSSAAPVPAAASAPRASAASSAAASASRASAASSVVASAASTSASAAAPIALSGPVPSGSHRLRFKFEGDAWVEVRDANGKSVLSRLNPAGTEQEVQGAAPLKLVIGNAPQVKLTVDGQAMELGSRTTSNVARITLP